MDNKQSSTYDGKAALRNQMKKVREALPHEQRTVLSRAACSHLSAWLSRKGIASLMCYAPFRTELDTGPVMEWGWKSGIAVILPKSYPEDSSMSLHRVRGWHELAAGAYGIMEPDPAQCPSLPASFRPEVIVVPGLAFDRQGGRMGYGGGYYDRFAERLDRLAAQSEEKTVWIGAAFEAQVTEGIPMQAHDRRMDGILTENGLDFVTQGR